MKKLYRALIFVNLMIGSCGSPLSADPSTGYYLKKIKHIEKILDDGASYDVECLKSELSSLRSKVTSPSRLQRIDAAYRRLRASAPIVQESARRPVVNQEQMPVVPTPTPRQSHTNSEQMPIVPNPLPNPTFEQRAQEIETLLLYVRSMIATADVAVVLKQKDNAHDALQQARIRLQEVNDILLQNSVLRERFASQTQALAGNIEHIQKQVKELP